MSTKSLFDEQHVDTAETTVYATPPARRPKPMDPAKQALADLVTGANDHWRQGFCEGLARAAEILLTHRGDTGAFASKSSGAILDEGHRRFPADFAREMEKRR
jgi:hypothetical protein